MRILIYSPYFFPKLGGVEVKAMGLAEKFVANGHEVVVVTNTANTSDDNFPYKVIRNPGFRQYMNAFKNCDLYMQMNVSLRGIYPFLFFRKPFFLSHENTYYKADGSINLNGRLKYFISSLARINFCCSAYIAQYIKKDRLVVGSPYREDVFFSDTPYNDRLGEIVFLGRLVSDKGCNILIEALNILHKTGSLLHLSIIGDGPEKNNLIALTEKYGLSNFINFYGSVTGQKLKGMLNEHKIMVVPSLWKEPFGIVALEGLACGCRLIVSEEGGLTEAVGNCGYTFPNGNAEMLAQRITEAMKMKNNNDFGVVQRHLQNYSLQSVSMKYLDAFKSLISK